MESKGLLVKLTITLTLAVFFLWPHPFNASLPEKVVSLVYFTLLSYSLGYSITRGVAFTGDAIELHLMRTGFVLAFLPMMIILLDTLNIPLHWLVLAVLSLAYPLLEAAGIVGGQKKRLKKTPLTWHTALALATACLAFGLALAGSFAFPYLEDGDSWEHAVGVKYISVFGTYVKPAGVYVSHYLPPYPPTYDALLGIIHQLNSHLQWTLKSFNALLVGLTFAYAYFFTREYTSDGGLALYSVVFLAAVPAFASHVIWSHTLAVAVFYPLFYALVKSKKQPGFTLVSALLLAGSLLVQPLMSLVIGVFFLLYVLSHIINDRINFTPLLKVGVLGLALSMVYWLPALMAGGTQLEGLDRHGSGLMSSNLKVGVKSGDRAPGIRDLLFPRLGGGDLYMQHGFGFFIFLLMAAGCFIVVAGERRTLRDRPWLMTSLMWLIFSFTMLQSLRLPFTLFPSRFWGLVPVGGSVVAAYATVKLSKHLSKYGVSSWFTGLVVVSLVLLTSWLPKLTAQTDEWPSDLGTFLDGQIGTYVVLYSLPPDTMVYPLCLGDKYVLGLDKMSLPWEPEVVEFREGVCQKNASEVHGFLNRWGYEYAIYDVFCVKECISETSDGEECIRESDAFVKGLRSHPGFELVVGNDKAGLFKVS
jgi:hypothetical protein